MEPGRNEGRRRVRRAVAVAVALVLPAVLALACSSSPALVAAGGDCFAASDCQPGLVCVPQKNGPRVCSSDLTQVTGRPPEEGDAAMAEAGEAATDAPVADGPEQDTSMPADTGVKDAADAG